jgi:hypothetical protein
MTTSAMQRASDVASIMGIDINSAMEAVSGAAKGNFTMMDNLGVAINDTTLQIYAQEKGLGKLETTQQKVNAAMQMFLEKTEYAAGNYAKENETFAGALTTLRAELENLMAMAGTEFLPAAAQGISVLSSVISDFSPAIRTVATGLGTLGQAIGLLENPAARGIAYAVAGVTALNKLKLAVGGTASGLILLGSILTFILGKYVESQRVTEEEIEIGMNGASSAADVAAKSTDKLTDSLGEAEKAASRLAGFDEITKLSGGSSGGSLASSIVSSEDLSNIDAASDSLASLQTDINSFNVPDVSFNPFKEIDFDELKKDIEALGDDIVLAFTGSETESYHALRRLNKRIELLFSEEWTEFWGGVGEDIYTIFNGAEEESFQALSDLNEKIKQLPFGETFDKIGQALGKGLYNLTEGFKAIAEGDFDLALEKFKSAIVGNLSDSKYALSEYVINDVGTGMGSAFNVAAWAAAGGPNAQTFGGVSEPPASMSDMYSFFGGVPTMMTPIQLQAVLNLDGERIGETNVSYNDGQVQVTNGRG